MKNQISVLPIILLVSLITANSSLLAADGHTSIVINEFMASNSSTLADSQGQFDDWIELYNKGATAIDIGGMYLTDDLSVPNKWQIPIGTPISANGYLLIWADNDIADSGLHANFKLSADGEELGLFDVNGVTLVDSIVFGQQSMDMSYGRYPDADNEWQYMNVPTPLLANYYGYTGITSEPQFSIEHGFFDAPFLLTIITDTGGASIYYTLNGKEPTNIITSTNLLYTGSILINKTTCLRARAFKPGYKSSGTITQTYIFGASNAIKSLPVISLVGDENTSLFEPDGIMAIVGGTYNNNKEWVSSGPGSYNNPMQRGIAYERPVSFEILDFQTGTNVQIDCGIRVQGSDYHRARYTRGNNWDGATYNYNKFSFKLFFRDDYGNDTFEYPFFPLADTDSFKTINIRGGHNDMYNPFIKDEMLRRLHKDMGGVTVTGTLACLYLNGQYKAFYNPCERLDQDFFRNYYNVDTDWDVITTREVRDGDEIAWNTTLDFFRTHDLSIASNYEQAGQMVDILDFIDYLIIELYCANWDWPNNNWTVSRERSPQGKFRFHCWDTEGTLETSNLNKFGFDDFPNYDTGDPKKGLNQMETDISWLYRALKANPEFRMLFADQIQKHFFNDGALAPANIQRRFTELRQQLSQLLPGMDTTILTNWIPNRHQIMLDKFTAEGLFPSKGPTLLVNGSIRNGGQISPTDQISLVNLIVSYEDNELVPERAAVRTFVPVNNSLGLTWTSRTYVPSSSWTDGSTTGVGYEKESGYEAWIGTDVSAQMYGRSNSVFARIEFNYDGSKNFEKLELQMRYDDGFIAYLNGTEVCRSNNITNSTPGSAAANSHEAASEYEKFDITSFKQLLVIGKNVLAIHGINMSTTSSDMLVLPKLIGRFNRTIYTAIPAWYTTDGSDPRLYSAREPTTISKNLIPESAAKKAFVPTEAISNDWRSSTTFNDSNWISGSGGVGYETETGYEYNIQTNVKAQMYGKNTSCYIRIPFTFTDDINNISALILKMRYDDGFVAYLNGTQILRVNFNSPSSPVWNSAATTSRSDSQAIFFVNFNISYYLPYLHQGQNILAIHGLNYGSSTDPDFLISTELSATVITSPGNSGISPSAIQYTTPVSLTKSTKIKTRILNGVATWSALNEAIYAVGPVAENLRITEIMYNPADTNNPNDPNKEFVELKNIGTEALNLNLVKFTKGIDYTFPDINLAPNQYIVVVKDPAAFIAQYGASVNIAGQYSGSLANNGERIRFEDAIGRQILDFTYSDGWRKITDGDGFSLTVINPASNDSNDWSQKDFWRASALSGGSPGWDDSGVIPNPGAVVINEIFAYSTSGGSDWIELHNTTTEPINIGGWFISDSDANLVKYEIAAGTTIAPGGYIVFDDRHHFDNPGSGNPGCHTPFDLSKNGETVYLSSGLAGALTGYRQSQDYGTSEPGVSFGRYYKSSTGDYDFVAMSAATPGAANAEPKTGPVVINEIMYYNPAFSYQDAEYIELRNISSLPVALYDYAFNAPWKFTDGIDYNFPADSRSIIPAGGYLILSRDPNFFISHYGAAPAGVNVLGPYNGELSNSSEKLELSAPGEPDGLGGRFYIRIDRVNYSDGSHPENCPGGVDLWPAGADGAGLSLNRKNASEYGNDVSNWQAAVPSAGKVNQ
jgi:hypothetical protein